MEPLGKLQVGYGAIFPIEIVRTKWAFDRITGRSPRSTERMVPGTMRFQFKSPPP
jgi:hypothetical protein